MLHWLPGPGQLYLRRVNLNLQGQGGSIPALHVAFIFKTITNRDIFVIKGCQCPHPATLVRLACRKCIYHEMLPLQPLSKVKVCSLSLVSNHNAVCFNLRSYLYCHTAAHRIAGHISSRIGTTGRSHGCRISIIMQKWCSITRLRISPAARNKICQACSECQ